MSVVDNIPFPRQRQRPVHWTVLPHNLPEERLREEGVPPVAGGDPRVVELSQRAAALTPAVTQPAGVRLSFNAGTGGNPQAGPEMIVLRDVTEARPGKCFEYFSSVLLFRFSDRAVTHKYFINICKVVTKFNLQLAENTNCFGGIPPLPPPPPP